MSKTFIEIVKSNPVEKFNPYHDRFGRFTFAGEAGGYGVSSSQFTGNKERQAVTFSANPNTVSGYNAIMRHQGVMPTAYNITGENPPQKQTTKPEKPKENTKQKETEKPTPRTTTKGEEAAQEVESKIVNRKTEKMYVYDQDGNEVFAQSGGRGSVRFSSYDAYRFADGIVTHNHPGNYGGTFSGADVNTATKWNVYQIRAVAKEGTYTLTRNEGVSSTQRTEFGRAYSKVSGEITSQVDSAYKVAKREYKAGNISIDEANQQIDAARTKAVQYGHNWLTQNASNYGYTYEYTTKVGKSMYKSDDIEPKETHNEGDEVLDGEFYSGDNWLIKENEE